jgi:hypothetical protein
MNFKTDGARMSFDYKTGVDGLTFQNCCSGFLKISLLKILMLSNLSFFISYLSSSKLTSGSLFCLSHQSSGIKL